MKPVSKKVFAAGVLRHIPVVFWVLLGVLAMLPATAPAAQVTIDFESFSALPPITAQPFSGGNEDGFTIMPEGTPIIQIADYGASFNPQLNAKLLLNTSSQLSSFSIVKTGGGNFQFKQLAATTTTEIGSPNLVKVEGFLGASSVGVENFTVLASAYFPAVNLAGKTIDRLVITVQSNVTGLPGITLVDNIVIEDNPPGSIIIKKVTDPADNVPVFSFTDNIEAPNNFNLDHGGSKTFTNVAAGTYGITETTPPSPWHLTGIRCDDDNSTGDLGTRTATIKLAAGETVTCTFTNRQLVNDLIIVEKVTDPPGGTGFTFTSNLTSFGLDDLGLKVFEDVEQGDYTITENDPTPAYDLTFLKCAIYDLEDGPPTVVDGNLTTRSVQFGLGFDQAVYCLFGNTQRGSLKVVKETQGGDGTFQFASPALSPPNFELTTSSGAAERTFSDLVPGSYDVSEIVPSGWKLDYIQCEYKGNSWCGVNYGEGRVYIELAAGDDVIVTFNNTKQAAVPALSQWGMIIFAALMALSFWWYGRMRLSRRR
jgi:hypothetical protein